MVDLNDRALRRIGRSRWAFNGIPRGGFDITIASELWPYAAATDIEDLKRRLANIVIGYSCESVVQFMSVVGSGGTMILKMVKPNLVQIYGTPAFVHGGLFT